MFEKVKDVINAGKHVDNELKSLSHNLHKLSQASQSVTAFSHDVQRAVDRFQFKTQPRLDKINELVHKMQQ